MTTLAQLEVFERERSTRASRMMAWSARPKVVRSGGETTHAPASAIAFASLRKLVHLGAVSEHAHPREVWVDKTLVHQLHAQAKLYFVITYFDDCSAVLTYSDPKPAMPKTALLAVRGGSGGVNHDYDNHVIAANAWATERHATALVVDDIETAARMVRHFYAVLAARSLLPSMLLGRLLG